MFDFNGVLLRTIPLNTFVPQYKTTDSVLDFVEADGKLVALVAHFNTSARVLSASIYNEDGVLLSEIRSREGDQETVNKVITYGNYAKGCFLNENYAKILFPFKFNTTDTAPNYFFVLDFFRDVNGSWTSNIININQSASTLADMGLNGTRYNPFRRLDY